MPPESPDVASFNAAWLFNLSAHHLLGAARLSREVHAVEKANAGGPFGEFFEEILQRSTAVVMLSAASVEAYINEQLYHLGSTLSGEAKFIWESVAADDVDQKTVLEKVDWYLTLRGKGVLPRGDPPSQKMTCLIKLRNALIHFRPEWSNEVDKHHELSKKLKNYLVNSPWMPDELLFPRAWATYAATKWAVETSIGYLDALADQAGTPRPMAPFLDRLATA